ncbi:hypothetical protein [Roseicyclus elongatus]|uniref:hypothetical protein n=1 Tax=Roseicyclus elongatus TaxID=159346 RepID=UPI001FDF619E|nr:hypothetical protein [Roseibacterium elongatum]
MQGRVGPAAEVALITLACPVAGARAEIAASATLGLEQAEPLLDIARCRGFLRHLGLADALRIRLQADLPPGGGAGMSTASLVALARAAGAPEDRIAAACLAVEGATDPVMLPCPDAVLWAPRSARCLAGMPPPPAAEIVGGYWGPPCRTDPGDTAFPEIDDLVSAWATGPDLPEAARLAARSATRTTRSRGPKNDPTPAMARDLAALGWARAHTGPARALIFAPGQAPADAEDHLRRAGYTHILRFRTGGRA